MATAARITGAITRWWWVRHAPVPNPEGRCYGQSDKDCDVSNEELFQHQAALLPKGAVWYSSNPLRANQVPSSRVQTSRVVTPHRSSRRSDCSSNAVAIPRP